MLRFIVTLCAVGAYYMAKEIADKTEALAGQVNKPAATKPADSEPTDSVAE